MWCLGLVVGPEKAVCFRVAFAHRKPNSQVSITFLEESKKTALSTPRRNHHSEIWKSENQTNPKNLDTA